MRVIEINRHKDMVEAIKKLEGLAAILGNTISQDHDDLIHKTAIELKATYDFYLILQEEMERCIDFYDSKHEHLQKLMHPYLF